MKKLFLILMLCICSIASAAQFKKGQYSNFTHFGPTGSYSINPYSDGRPNTIVSQNLGWLPVPQSPGAALQKTERLPFPPGRSLDVNARVIASPGSLARALVNPWTFISSMLLQQMLGELADQACTRIAGGQMTNTGGMWEECVIKNEPGPYYQCSYYGRSAQGPDLKTVVETCLPPGTKDPWGNTYVRFSHIVENTCGIGCHNVMFELQNRGSTSTELVGPFGIYQSERTTERKTWEPTTQENAIAKITPILNSNPQMSSQIFQELYQNNVPVEVYDPQIIIGPATGPAGDPVTTTYSITNSTTNNSTSPNTTNYEKTVTTTNHYTYNNNTVTITHQTIVTTIINLTTNEITTETKEQPMEALEDFCSKNPDSISCKDINFDTPDGEIPRNSVNLTYEAESFLNGGACPADVYVNAGGQQVKAIDWASHCSNIVTYLKPLVILISSFIALLILVPGGREVAS